MCMNKTKKRAEDNFKQAIREALLDEYDAYVPEQKEHTFSKEFESRMQKIIRRRRKSYYMWINTAGKRVACFMILILIVSLFLSANVEAIDKFFQYFEIRRFKEGADIWLDKLERADEESPKKIEEIYQITYDLSGYKITWENNDLFIRWKVYERGEKKIEYMQWTKDEFNASWNTEGADIQQISINKNKGIKWKDKNNSLYIIWGDDKYVFSIITDYIDEKTALQIAESVKS